MSVFDNNHNLTFSAMFSVEVLQYNGNRFLSSRELKDIITNALDKVVDEKDMMYFDRATSRITWRPGDKPVIPQESAKHILKQLVEEDLFYAHTTTQLQADVFLGEFIIFTSNGMFRDRQLEFRVVRRYEYNGRK